jgi:hypothetical protein
MTKISKSKGLCKELECSHESTTAGFCRLHYIKLLAFEKQATKAFTPSKRSARHEAIEEFGNLVKSSEIGSSERILEEGSLTGIGELEMETDSRPTDFVEEIYRKRLKKTG